MHEMGLALEIHRACREAAAAHDAVRIERVALRVGELSAVEPDLLQFAWEAVTAEGPDAGSTLEITWCPARQHCPSCGAVPERVERGWMRLCEACGQPLLVEGGDELDVVEMTLETEDPPDPGPAPGGAEGDRP